MIATQPYPSSQFSASGMSPSPNPQGPSRSVYRVPSSGSGTLPTQYSPYPTSAHQQHNVYLQHDMNTYGLITPPNTTPAQFGSPLIANGGYPLPGGTPGSQWSMNALALSSVGATDPSLAYGYGTSPLLSQDPSCAAPGEVFSSPTGMYHHHQHHPQHHHPHHLQHGGVDGLGFPHSTMSHAHAHSAASVYRGGPVLGLKPHHGHLILGADGQPTIEIKKRSRTAQACERCRIRKARCFGGNPCNRCTKRRFVCEFSTAVRQRGPSKPNQTGSGPASATEPGSAASSTPSGTATKSPASPTKPHRRHSLPEGSSPAYAAKTYSSSDVQALAAVGEEGPVAYSLPGSTVILHLPTPTGGEYLNVPGSAGGATSTPLYGSGQHSPMFPYRSDSLDGASSAPTTGSSADYPYTPISPSTAISPTLGMTPTVGGMYPNTVAAAPSPAAAAPASAMTTSTAEQQQQQQIYYSAA